MVLRGGLSNHLLTDLLQCLTGLEPHQARPQSHPRAGWPDGRRSFATVSRAIVAVLKRDGGEMSTKAIREQVEALLGGTVSRFSISDYLLTRSKGGDPLFTRTRHGHYRMR
jgi:hypothetical protein